MFLEMLFTLFLTGSITYMAAKGMTARAGGKAVAAKAHNAHKDDHQKKKEDSGEHGHGGGHGHGHH
jgi:hypothetical protein